MGKIRKNKNIPSEQELEILEYIKCFIEEHQYSPSVAEIKERFGISSLSVVSARLQHMKSLGLINYQPNASRTISIVGFHLHFFPGNYPNPTRTM